MILKGIVSTIDTTNNTARVLIIETNRITSELKIAGGVGSLNIRDEVLIAYTENNMTDGIIIAKADGEPAQYPITEIDGGSFI